MAKRRLCAAAVLDDTKSTAAYRQLHPGQTGQDSASEESHVHHTAKHLTERREEIPCLWSVAA